MSKKIVIAPVFCEAHLIKYQIDNIVDTINPDYIIYNEGMFPAGPESSTLVNSSFIYNYTLDGHRGFDYQELVSIIEQAQIKHPQCRIILNPMNYGTVSHAPTCYYMACSNFKQLGITIEKGDYIFPFEGDVFHHENSKTIIEGYLTQLQPNTGFKSNWIDFIETQYYCERSTLKPFLDNKEGRHRRVCIRYGDEAFYKEVLLNFMTQKYPMLYPTDLLTFHYCWWRPGKYKQLRYDQLNRPAEYWQHFDKALAEIRQIGNTSRQDVVLRPSHDSSMTSHWASYFDIPHPKHIKQHPNYLQ